MIRKAVRKAVLAGVLLNASACGQFHEGPEAVAVDYVTATMQGDAATVDRMVYWGADIKEHPNEKMILEGKVNSSVKNIAKRTRAAGGFSGVKAVSVQLQTVDGYKMATVMVKYRLNNGESHTEAVKMIEINDKWMAKVG